MPSRIPPETYQLFDAFLREGLSVRDAALCAGISVKSGHARWNKLYSCPAPCCPHECTGKAVKSAPRGKSEAMLSILQKGVV